MPSSLKHFGRRPKFIPKYQWKGAGYYYTRESGSWTKYSKKRDKARRGKVGRGKYRHTHDRKR